MRAVLHVIATLLLVPYLVMAAAFLLADQVFSGGSWGAMLDTLLAHALWLIPWGIIGFGAFIIVLAALGLSAGSARLGARIVYALATGSLLVMLVVPTSPIDAGVLLFLLPCIIVAGVSAWLAAPRRLPAGTIPAGNVTRP